MWHEGCASRGALEIGTCLWTFVRNSVQKGVNRITAFCDSCSGQNRNFKIATLMSHCVNSLPLESCTVHYMQSGHSYLPNDAVVHIALMVESCIGVEHTFIKIVST